MVKHTTSNRLVWVYQYSRNSWGFTQRDSQLIAGYYSRTYNPFDKTYHYTFVYDKEYSAQYPTATWITENTPAYEERYD